MSLHSFSMVPSETSDPHLIVFTNDSQRQSHTVCYFMFWNLHNIIISACVNFLLSILYALKKWSSTITTCTHSEHRQQGAQMQARRNRAIQNPQCSVQTLYNISYSIHKRMYILFSHLHFKTVALLNTTNIPTHIQTLWHK